MRFQFSDSLAALTIALATSGWIGCDMHSAPNPQGGRTTVIESPPPAEPKGVHINVEPNNPPATPPGKGDVKVNVDPQTGVNVKVDGQPVRDFLKERREEAQERTNP